MRGEEDLHQLLADVADDELAELLRLGPVTLFGALFDADPDRLQRLFRRGIVAVRLRQQRLARLLEKDAPADRIFFQRDGLQDFGVGHRA